LTVHAKALGPGKSGALAILLHVRERVAGGARGLVPVLQPRLFRPDLPCAYATNLASWRTASHTGMAC
jgi:hypothetical protein